MVSDRLQLTKPVLVVQGSLARRRYYQVRNRVDLLPECWLQKCPFNWYVSSRAGASPDRPTRALSGRPTYIVHEEQYRVVGRCTKNPHSHGGDGEACCAANIWPLCLVKIWMKSLNKELSIDVLVKGSGGRSEGLYLPCGCISTYISYSTWDKSF